MSGQPSSHFLRSALKCSGLSDYTFPDTLGKAPPDDDPPAVCRSPRRGKIREMGGGFLRRLCALTVLIALTAVDLTDGQTVRSPSDTVVVSQDCDGVPDSLASRAFAPSSSTPPSTSFVIGAGEPLPFDVQVSVGFDRCSVSTGDEVRVDGRPSGPWDFIVDARVPKTPQSIFNILVEPE